MPLLDDLGHDSSATNTEPAQAVKGLLSDIGHTDWSTSESTEEAPKSAHPVTEEASQIGTNIAKSAVPHIIKGLGTLADLPGDVWDLAFHPGEDHEPEARAVADKISKKLEQHAPSIFKPIKEGPIERIVGQGIEAAPSALIAGPEGAMESLIPTTASGAAFQTAKEMGAGPVGQFVAGMSPMAPAALAAGTRALVRGGEAGAENTAQNLQNAANADIKLSTGQATENGALRSAETVGAKIPFGSKLAETRGQGLNHQVEESVSNITKKLAPTYNQKPPTPMAAGEHIQESVKSSIGSLKNETNEAAEAMHEAVGGKDAPWSAPKFEETIKKVTSPTGIADVDSLVTGAKTKAVARVADKVANQPKVPTSYTSDGEGAHIASSPNGETHAVEQANGDLKVWRSDTSEAARGNGEGTARLEALAHAATSKGKSLVSDISVSPGEVKAYEKLRDRGWDVQKNPNAEVLGTGNLVSDSPKNPVFTIKAPKTETLPGEGHTKGSAEGQFSGEWTYNPKTGQSEPVVSPRSDAGPSVQSKAVLNPETPWTFDSLKQLRTAIGKELRPGISDTRQGQLRQLYGALSDDLKAGVAAKGPAAEQAYDFFNHVASQNAATQKTLVRAVKSIGGPEQVFKTAMNGSKDGATKLTPIIKSLNPEGQNLFRATVLHRMGRTGGSAEAPFDANVFFTNWKGMSPEAKGVLFGEGANAGPPTQLRKSLDSLSDTIDLLKRQGYIKSGFVKGVEAGTGGLQKVGIFGALAYLAHTGGSTALHVAEGHPFLAAGAATGATALLAGNPIMSRVLTNPKTAAWLAQATKAPKGMVPILLNQLDKMGTKDQDAKDLHALIQQAGNIGNSGGGPTSGTKANEEGAPEKGTIYPKINRSAGMQPLPGGGYGIPPETM